MSKKLKGNYRSIFERRIAKNSDSKIKYESEYLIWQPPEKKYTPDFILENGIIVEAKGVLTPQDRLKMVCVKNQHPNRDIRFLFMRAANKLNKHSKTTYAQWAEKNGFKWAEGAKIPESWVRE